MWKRQPPARFRKRAHRVNVALILGKGAEKTGPWAGGVNVG